jgi:hypothetical protein
VFLEGKFERSTDLATRPGELCWRSRPRTWGRSAVLPPAGR